MPRYRWFCKDESCKATWEVYASVERRDDPVVCPDCGGDAERNFAPRIYYTPDIDHTEGRTGEPVDMPAFGPNTRISSRRELRELQKRAPEEYYRRTEGPHTTIRPFKDPKTGKITMEKVTTHSKGIELGEIHTMETPDPGEPVSIFDPKKTLSQHERELKERLGGDEDLPPAA